MRPEFHGGTNWEFHSEVTDLGKDRENWAACDACTGGGKRVRYLHHIQHPVTGQVLNTGSDCACILTGCVKAGEIEERTRELRHFREVEKSGKQCFCTLCTGQKYGDATISPWRQWEARSGVGIVTDPANRTWNFSIRLVRKRFIYVAALEKWICQEERRDDVSSIYRASLMTNLPRQHFIELVEKRGVRADDTVFTPRGKNPNKFTWAPAVPSGSLWDNTPLAPRALISEFDPSIGAEEDAEWGIGIVFEPRIRIGGIADAGHHEAPNRRDAFLCRARA
jgi:hypothetical protein